MAAEYKVLKIDELTKPDDVRGIKHAYRHTIKTKGGVILSVEVSEENFTEEKVAPILLAAAQNADKILRLGG